MAVQDSESHAEQGVNEESPPSTDGAGESSTPEEKEPTSVLEAVEQGMAEFKDDDGEQQDDPDQDEDPEGGTDEDKGKGAEGEPDDDKSDDGDPETIEIPDDIKSPKSQERFRELATAKRDLTKENETLKGSLETAQRDLDGFRHILSSSGVTPAGFKAMMDMSSARSTGDAAGALKILDQMRMDIAREGGIKITGVKTSDLLKDHPDLAKRVEDMDMDEDAALEVARARDQSRQFQAQHQQQQDVDRGNQARETAANKMIQMSNEWAKSDLHFKDIEQQLVDRAKLIANTYPPESWPGLLEQEYQSLKAMRKSLGGATERKLNPDPNSIRGPSGGGGTKEPQSAAEAIMSGLGKR